MLDWHSCQICCPLEIKILLSLLQSLSLIESKAGNVLYKGHNNPRADFRARAQNMRKYLRLN